MSVPHPEFVRGAPAGHFKFVVNPQVARVYVRQRLWILPICISLAGIGMALALTQRPWWGLGLVAGAVLLNRLVRLQAPQILLHLALSDERVYWQAQQLGALEVQTATMQE
ncbi:MAG: hypothetical protein RLZZ126_15 [Pseudomonadota bacterium]